MSQIHVLTEAQIPAPADVVRKALQDYATIRPRILTDEYREYRVLEGGEGDGTVAAWTLQATKKRSRDVIADIDVTTHGDVVERDRNSTLVTTWKAEPLTDRTSTVKIETTWKGAGGVGGFFERTFAPNGLRAIQSRVLAKLADELQD
ncbi:SRPBCC family protein [Patulibacter sp. NPDC049589]|uniref:SRPBCC family protein n=1 Tax=Patulibacter sp. NPDC049589 TaxID=3154731 RepID=UPI00343AA0E3